MKRELNDENRTALAAEIAKVIAAMSRAQKPAAWLSSVSDLFELTAVVLRCSGLPDAPAARRSSGFERYAAIVRLVTELLPPDMRTAGALGSTFAVCIEERAEALADAAAWRVVDNLKPPPKPREPKPPKAEVSMPKAILTKPPKVEPAAPTEPQCEMQDGSQRCPLPAVLRVRDRLAGANTWRKVGVFCKRHGDNFLDAADKAGREWDTMDLVDVPEGDDDQ